MGRAPQHAHQGLGIRRLGRTAPAVTYVLAKLPGIDRGKGLPAIRPWGDGRRRFIQPDLFCDWRSVLAGISGRSALRQPNSGGALRQSENFLLAYSLLKEKRLGSHAKLAGSNIRSAWAFTLWGDPSLRLPAPPIPTSAAEATRCRVHGDSITLTVPPTAGAEASGKFRVPYQPNERLAGLVRPAADDDKKLVPFVFAEVKLPNGPPARRAASGDQVGGVVVDVRLGCAGGPVTFWRTA